MKKSTVILLCLLAAAAAAWFMSTPGDSTTVLLQAKPQKEYKKMSGVLSLVDAPGRAIIVSNAGLNRRFDVDPAAEILQNGVRCILAELERGSATSVQYSIEGKVRLAHRVIAQARAPRPASHSRQETRPASAPSDPR